MGVNIRISIRMQEAWMKLNSKWQGEAAEAFRREYIVKASDILYSFEAAYSELSSISSELESELQGIENTLA